MALTRPPLIKGRELQRGIIEAARRLHWRVAHFPPISTTRGGKTFWLTPVAADGKGFPDLVLIRERVVWVEVKGKGDYLTAEQHAWLTALRLAGQEVYVWTPVDWADGVIDETLRRRRHGSTTTSEAGDEGTPEGVAAGAVEQQPLRDSAP